MVVVAQLVRASVCGTEGRGFEPHHPPLTKKCVAFCKAFFSLNESVCEKPVLSEVEGSPTCPS